MTAATITVADELRAAAARLRDAEHHGGITGDCDNPELLSLIVALLEAREPLASWLDLAAGRYDEDVYEDEIGCNPGGTHGDFCEADCPGHKPVAICDRCGTRVGPDAPEGSRCGCWDKALAVARVLNGTSP
jgi:hypothetical protein